MNKPQVGDQGYQAVAHDANEKSSPSVDVNDCSDVPTKRIVNSEEPCYLTEDGETARSDGVRKKFYSKPTLIDYGTARDSAGWFGPKSK
jgi:hypothetical protein